MKGGLPSPTHLILHQPPSIPPANCLFIFYVVVMNTFFFSISDIIIKQKELCEKIKNSKIGK